MKIILPESADTIVETATVKDFLFIDSLRKKEPDALGFIPKDQYMSILTKPLKEPERWYNNLGDVLLTKDNGDLTGFLYCSYAGPMAKIFQVVIQRDARRWHRALLLADQVEGKAREKGCVGVSCRVAIDLEANHFWRAIGYEPVKQVTSTFINHRESWSKRQLYIYEKYFNPGFFGDSTKPLIY